MATLRVPYTQPLWIQSGFVTANIYIGPTVPAGELWVVRGIAVLGSGVWPGEHDGYIFTDAGGAPIWTLLPPDSVQQQGGTWEGRQALVAGDGLRLQLGAPGGKWRVTGYKFQTP